MVVYKHPVTYKLHVSCLLQVERAAAVIGGTFLIVVSMTVLENVLSAMFRGYNENRDYK